MGEKVFSVKAVTMAILDNVVYFYVGNLSWRTRNIASAMPKNDNELRLHRSFSCRFSTTYG